MENTDELEQFSCYVRDRITKLRQEKGVSEYQMSLDLGQNRTYIQNISSGRSLPSMSAFCKICMYFDITPIEFFDFGLESPNLYKSVRNEIGDLCTDDLELLNLIIKRFNKK